MLPREPFPYETNASLIRLFLVPDPLPACDWEQALSKWKNKGAASTLMEGLITGGTMTEEDLLSALGRALDVQTIPRAEIRESSDPSPEAHLLRTHGYLILEPEGPKKLLAGGPTPKPELSKLLGQAAEVWKWVLISPLRASAREIQSAVNEEENHPDSFSIPAWLEGILLVQWSCGAADIHFEREGSHLVVRAQCGGRMQHIGTWRDKRVETSLRLLKTWAGFSTAAETLPQDGRISITLSTRAITFRISHVMTVNGESIVLRNLGSESEIRSLEELMVPPELKKQMLDCAMHAPGLVIISGRTGSGKTTTLYALIVELLAGNMKILTIEDPVEYELPNAVQSAVNTSSGWTFGTAIRAYLRQDPDVILLGEMRDQESAEAACRASLTGHCVLTTLHARSEKEALERLKAWGIKENLLRETVRLIVNQRLLNDETTGTLRAEFNWSRLS